MTPLGPPSPPGPGPVEPGADQSGATRPTPLDRPPRGRTDPAAMRETLDLARRRLGPAGPTDEPRSAERLRALLREAANQTATSRPSSPAARRPSPYDDAGDPFH